MEWNIEVRKDQGYVEIRTRGVADKEASLGMASALSAVMRENRVTRALIDHRALDGVAGGVSDVYERPRLLRLIGAILRIRLAEVVRPEHLEHFAFFETVCRNQGFELRVFHNRDEGVMWLLR
jgi:hypothetical protein